MHEWNHDYCQKVPVELEQGLPWKVAGKITYRNLGEMN